MLEVGAAAAGVGDDGVELVRRELLKLLARELLGHFPFAVMGVERAAAELLGRRDDFAAVAGEDFDGVAVDVAEDQVLGAADEHGDPILLPADGGRDGRDQLGGELGLDVGRDAFELLEAFGQELEHAAAADEGLQPELLVDPQDAAHQTAGGSSP